MTLADYLQLHGLTHAEFAAKIGVSFQAVQRYAQGRRIPQREIMQRIVVVTGNAVGPNDFFASPKNECRARTIEHPMTKPPADNYLRAWRKYRGFTQQQLANQLPIGNASISMAETGAQWFSKEGLYAAAEVLQCQPGDILSYPPQNIGRQIAALVTQMPAPQQELALRLIRALEDAEKVEQ